MANFKPDNRHIGKQVYARRDNKPDEHLGILQQIVNPHHFIVNGFNFEVDATYDFHPDADGNVYLMDPW